MTATDFSRRGKRSKRRGDRGEREVAVLLRKHGWADSHRNFMSGGAGGGDLADAIPDHHLEVKLVERLDLPGAFRQARAAARPTDTIVVVSRCNFQPWIATLELADLLDLDLREFAWAPVAIGSRASLRGEFMQLAKRCEIPPSSARPLVVHPVGSIAMASVPLEALLALLALREFGT